MLQLFQILRNFLKPRVTNVLIAVPDFAPQVPQKRDFYWVTAPVGLHATVKFRLGNGDQTNVGDTVHVKCCFKTCLYKTFFERFTD